MYERNDWVAMKGGLLGALVLASILAAFTALTDGGIAIRDVPGILAIGVIGAVLGASIALGGENRTKALGFIGGWFAAAAIAAVVVFLMYLALR